MGNLTQHQCYERLNILDAKCTSLLQLSAVLAAIQSIPIAAAATPLVVRIIGAASVLTFLIVSIIAVSVLAVDWEPDATEIERRTKVYNWCRAGTRLGLVVGTVFVCAAIAVALRH